MAEIKTSITNIAQRRADFAYQCAEDRHDKNKSSEYKSYVKKIPMLIKSNGLSATFAFMLSKGGTYNTITAQCKEWLNHYSVLAGELKGNVDLVEKIIQLNSTDYRAITNEVLALFNWLRRFAEGLIGE
jgi:CRISPR-associated protein Cmr5